jgi:Carbohydrate family 9 binding domain-like
MSLGLTTTLFLCATSGAADVAAVRATPVIDGVITEGEWHGAAVITLDHQIRPGDNAPPSVRTEARFAFDARNLYFAITAHDDEAHAIRGPVSRRDAILDDDFVTVYFDTYDDRRRAYVFSFNPRGVQSDGIYTEGITIGRNFDGNIDRSWDGVLTSIGRIGETGYVVEVAIPFATLRFASTTETRWGLHVERWVARKGERISWRPISRDVSSLLTQMGGLSGLRAESGGPSLELIPTLIGSLTSERAIDGDLADDGQIDAGVTAVWAATPTLSVSGTVNPDFSQIEADVPQIEVNQRFPLSYPEKRPFFYEGGQVFRSPGALNFLHTRQIVDPDWGAKATGKIGRNTVGVLAASDRAPGLRVPPGAPGTGENATFLVSRYQRDVFQNSTIGGFFNDYRFAGKQNSVVAADGQIRLPLNTIGFQLAKSWTSPGGGVASSVGDATYVWYDFVGRHWRLFLNDQRVSADYQSEASFVRRRDFRVNSITAGHEFQSEGPSRWVRARPFVVARRLETGAGVVDESYVDPGIDVVFARDISVYTYYSFHQDAFGGREYPYQFYSGSVTVNTFKRVLFNGRLVLGEGVNFDPAYTVVGRALDANVTMTFKPQAQLDSEWLILRSQLSDPLDDRLLFRQTVVRNRTNYQFTRDHAVRLIAEYNSLVPIVSLSLLYGWTPRPNTAVYVGYGDILEEPATADHVMDRGFERIRQTFFVKLSRGWRR